MWALQAAKRSRRFRPRLWRTDGGPAAAFGSLVVGPQVRLRRFRIRRFGFYCGPLLLASRSAAAAAAAAAVAVARAVAKAKDCIHWHRLLIRLQCTCEVRKATAQ